MINKIPLLEDFILFKQTVGLKSKTIDEYVDSISKFADWIAEYTEKSHLTRYSYKTITESDAQTYLFKLRETLSINSTKKYLAGVSQFFKWLKKNGYIDQNPFHSVEMQKNKEHVTREYMTYEESQLLINSIDNDYEKLMMMLMSVQTYRINEVCNILVENINLESNTINALRKNSKWQELKIRKELREMVADRVAYCKERGHKYLFQSPIRETGIDTNTVRTIFIKWRDAVGLNSDYSPHDLRRVACFDLYYNLKLELFKVSKIMNHSSVRTTEIYLKIDQRAINDELEDL